MTGGRIFIVLCLAVANAITGTACDESLRSVAGPSPNLEPRFLSIQREIFETGTGLRTACATVRCHASAGRIPAAGELDLRSDRTYADLVNVPASGKRGAIRVIPGDPDNSYLIQKLEGAPGIVGRRMPEDGPPYLTAGQIQIIRRWIQLGALTD